MMGLFLLGLLSALQFQIVCASIFAVTIAPSFLVLAASGILFDAGSMTNVDTNSEFERRPPRKPPDKVGASALQTLDLETIEHQSQHRLVAIGRATFPFIFSENLGKNDLVSLLSRRFGFDSLGYLPFKRFTFVGHHGSTFDPDVHRKLTAEGTAKQTGFA